MDKSFNFFKAKIKKQNEKPRNHSRSSSSKFSYSAKGNKVAQIIAKQLPLTKKEKEIREAIEHRYQQSKIKQYRFQRMNDSQSRSAKSSHSSEMEQYKCLKKSKIVNLKDYHKKDQFPATSRHSSQQKKKLNVRFKLKDSSTIIKTESNDSFNKSFILSQAYKSSSKMKNAEEWKYIGIHLKEELVASKEKRNQGKMNSHRTYNTYSSIQPHQRHQKNKSTSAMSHYAYNIPKLKQLIQLNRAKF